jgi:hypothetical protein
VEDSQSYAPNKRFYVDNSCYLDDGLRGKRPGRDQHACTHGDEDGLCNEFANSYADRDEKANPNTNANTPQFHTPTNADCYAAFWQFAGR